MCQKRPRVSCGQEPGGDLEAGTEGKGCFCWELTPSPPQSLLLRVSVVQKENSYPYSRQVTAGIILAVGRRGPGPGRTTSLFPPLSHPVEAGGGAGGEPLSCHQQRSSLWLLSERKIQKTLSLCRTLSLGMEAAECWLCCSWALL